MRVIFNTSFEDGSRSIGQAAQALDLAQRQVASGRRITSASDDPLGTAAAITEHATLDRLDAYASASDSASYKLSLADSVLSDMVNQLTSAQTTALAARGTTVTQAQRDAAANEVLAIRDALMSDINTQFQGTYLFSGSSTTTAPFVRTGSGTGISAYQGNTAATSVDVANGRSVASTFDGGAILQGGDPVSVLDALTTLAAAISAGDQTGMANGIDAVNRAFDRATAAQSRIGNDLRTTDDVRVSLADARQHAQARVSKIEDVDLSEASMRLAQSETAYRAALAAMGTVGRLSLMDYLR